MQLLAECLWNLKLSGGGVCKGIFGFLRVKGILGFFEILEAVEIVLFGQAWAFLDLLVDEFSGLV